MELHEKTPPAEKIELTMEEAKRILEWRGLIHPKEEEKHWGDDDNALIDKLLNFVDDWK